MYQPYVLQVKPQIYLQVNDRLIPLVAYSANFGVNEIPQLSCVVGAGRNVIEGDASVDIDEIIREIVTTRPEVVVLGRFFGQESAENQYDGEETVLFRGKVSHAGTTRTRGRVESVIYIKHWLSGLDEASLAVPFSYPTSSANLILPAISQRNFTQSGNQNLLNSPRGLALPLLAWEFPNDLTKNMQDLWGNLVLPFLENMAKTRSAGITTGIPKCVADVLDEPHQKTLNALKRMAASSRDEGLPSYAVPLSVLNQVPGVAGQSIGAVNIIRHNIRRSLTSIPTIQMAQSTAWGYILNVLNPSVHSMVVPQIEQALVVPRCAAINKHWQKVIARDDIIQMDTQQPASTPVRGYLIGLSYAAASIRDGSAEGSGSSENVQGVCWTPTPTPESGLLKYAPAPPWLQSVPLIQTDISELSQSVSRGVAGPGEPSKVDQEELAALGDEYAALYAKAMYNHERLMHRTMKLSVRLRWDIAPGSTVKVETGEDNIDGLHGTFYGLVTRVTIMIDVSTKSAMTMLMLSHIRTEAEQISGGEELTIDRNPLFDTNFVGAPIHTSENMWFPNA